MHRAYNPHDDIMCVAQLLQISQVQVFERAYIDDHDTAPTAAALEQCFSQYVYRGIAPSWARCFARTMITNYAESSVAKGICSGFDFIVKLFVPPHRPETIGYERYRIFIA